MGHLVGANKTLIDHFAGIGNMVVMKSQLGMRTKSWTQLENPHNVVLQRR